MQTGIPGSQAGGGSRVVTNSGRQECHLAAAGLVDDDTDGHIDELACFTGPGQILALVSSDPKDANYRILQRNLDVLKAARDALGTLYDVVTIEQPPASYRDGVRLSMSYVNFYIANGGIVMPSYGFTDYDQEALKVMAQCFPHHQIEQGEQQ